MCSRRINIDLERKHKAIHTLMTGARCLRCKCTAEDTPENLEEVFGYKRSGKRFTQCKRCRARAAIASRRHYEEHREERLIAIKLSRARAYDELREKSLAKDTCIVCGREVSHAYLGRHQDSRYCFKRDERYEALYGVYRT